MPVLEKVGKRKKKGSRGSAKTLNMSAARSRSTKARGASDGLPVGALIAIVVVGLVLCAAALVYGSKMAAKLILEDNPRFSLARVELSTLELLPDNFVRSKLKVEPGDNLYRINLEEKRIALESHPVVRSAVISRQLPDTLKIEIKERSPIARIGVVRSNGYYLVDAEGVVLFRHPSYNHLPYLIGLPTSTSSGDEIGQGFAKEALQLLAYMRSKEYLRSEMDIEWIMVRHTEHLLVQLKAEPTRNEPARQIILPRDAFKENITKAARMLQIQREAELRDPAIRQKLVFDMTPKGENKIARGDR